MTITVSDSGTGRVKTPCSGCGQSDDAPKHVQYVVADHPVTHEPADLTVARHWACCAEAGCEVCATHVEFAGGKTGQALIDHAVNPPPEHLAALFERHGIESPAHNEGGQPEHVTGG